MRTSGRLPFPIPCLSLLACLALAMTAAGAPPDAPATSSEALAERLAADAWRLSPGSTTVTVGGDAAFELGQLECEVDGLLCTIRWRPRPDAVSRWQVNGIDGGNAEVGTVSRDAGGRWIYRAPDRVPRRNPVSLAAVIDGTQGSQLQLVSQVTVVPTGWSGDVRVSFEAARNGQGEARHESTLHDDPMYRTAGMYAFEIQRVLGIGGDIQRLSFDAAYPVKAAMVEALADDGTGLAIIELGIPKVAFSYDRVQKAGSSLGCRYTLGNSTVTEVDGVADLDSYQALPPSPLSFTLNADGTSTIMAIPPALVRYEGRSISYACDGDIGIGEIGPENEAFGDVSALDAGQSAHGHQPAFVVVDPFGGASMPVPASEATVPLPGAFRGRPGERGIYTGDLVLPGVMRVLGTDVPGTYRIRWNIRRSQR